MEQMPEENIIKFLKEENIEPIDDNNYGLGYRAAATLKDGTYLPCVIFRSTGPIVKLASRRFKEEQAGRSIFGKKSGIGYWQIVKSFVANGNCVNHYDIAKIEKSKFAFRLRIQNLIQGETSMSWTAFVATFKDGRKLGFGTTWNNEFFDVPEGYDVDDISEITNHSYLLKTGEVVAHRSSFNRIVQKEEMEIIYPDRQFFECYLDNL